MAESSQEIVARYLEKLRAECNEKQWNVLSERKLATAAELQAEPFEIQIAFLKGILGNIEALSPFRQAAAQSTIVKMISGLMGSKPAREPLNWMEFRTLGKIAVSVLKHKPPIPAKDLAEIVASYAGKFALVHHSFSPAPFVGAAESAERSPALEAAMRQLRQGFAAATRSSTRETRAILDRIDRYLAPEKETQVRSGGPWSQGVIAEIGKLPDAERSAWTSLLSHCLAAQSTSPSKAWRRSSEQTVAIIGSDSFREHALRWLDTASLPPAPAGQPIEDRDSDYLKGFVWLLAGSADEELCRIVADFGLACLRKIPNIGPVSARVGFACVNVLAEMPGLAPVSQLSRMRVKVKYAVGLNLIEKALNTAAERSGTSREDLEDMAVPTFGLDASGEHCVMLGECTALMKLPGTGENAVELVWKNAQSKAVKSPPAEIRKSHAAQLKEFKRASADLQKMLVAQKLRIEQFFISERSIALDHWRKYFLQHPVMSSIARRLVWHFETGGDMVLGAWLNGEIVQWNNEPVSGLSVGTWVRLWHPLQSEAQTIFNWRCWLEDHGIVQPFKQAHREVYLLTPAEERTETYSNRFAAHVIRQHQFASLCRERGWQYRLMGVGFDCHNVPTLQLPRWSMKAEFWVDVPGMDAGIDPRQTTDQISGSGINLYLLTDQVRFYRNDVQAPLRDVPPILFSEVMRDVDLFVGVTSIGNDPGWADHGNTQYGGYWHSFAFGDLSQSGETRRAILEKLLPQLKIASRCALDGKFLIIRGELHTYKIHLGSANVMMEPGSRYLCIVPARGNEGWQRGALYLPFEGDQTMAIILSKAFLLAADTKITDETILRQIGRYSQA